MRKDADGRLDESKLLFRAGELRSGRYAVDLSPSQAGWKYSGLRVLRLDAGDSARVPTEAVETGLLPLSGHATAEVDGTRYAVAGRRSPFSGPADFLYVPLGAELTVTSETGGEFALVTAAATRRLEPVHVRAGDVPVVSRGKGECARVVRNFCTPDTVEAERLLAVEVITPGGNWSSYPPHKHDEDNKHELPLEEIYYFRTSAPEAFALHSVYRRDERGGLDANTAMVEDGDLVVVPDSYHGPTVAGPGYDLYYLNVLAGPSQRALVVCDDPSHAWIRDRWSPAADAGSDFSASPPTPVAIAAEQGARA